jgi:hypothetical protein
VKITDPEERKALNEAWYMVIMMVIWWALLVVSMIVGPAWVAGSAAIVAYRKAHAVFRDSRNMVQGVGPIYWFYGDNTWSKSPIAVRYVQLRETMYPYRRGRGVGVLVRNTEVQIGFCRRDPNGSDLQVLDGRDLDVPVAVIKDWGQRPSPDAPLSEKGWGTYPAPVPWRNDFTVGIEQWSDDPRLEGATTVASQGEFADMIEIEDEHPDCPTCHGEGGRFVLRSSGDLDSSEWLDCPRCGGRGYVPTEELS